MIFSATFAIASLLVAGLVSSQLTSSSAPDHVSAKRHLIGVPPDKRAHYDLPPNSPFKCLDGSGTISLESVNDDYCDCRDASDEPGTAACPHGKFFCLNNGYMSRSLPAGWVNDGRCDCCDGTDEYESGAACADNCFVLGEQWREEQEKFRAIYEQGSTVRSQLKKDAKQKREDNTNLLEQYKRELGDKENSIRILEEDLSADFGPDSIYYTLKGQCFKFNDREYTYSLCPFERAVQESTNGMNTELGRWAGWAGPPTNLYSKQKYDNGLQCWNGPTRSAIVSISCGADNAIIAVREPSRCEYLFDFVSPAACPDLDPPTEAPAAVVTEEAPIHASDEEHESLEIEGEVEELQQQYRQESGHETLDHQHKFNEPNEDKSDEL